jgi:hypothetical protein
MQLDEVAEFKDGRVVFYGNHDREQGHRTQPWELGEEVHFAPPPPAAVIDHDLLDGELAKFSNFLIRRFSY